MRRRGSARSVKPRLVPLAGVVLLAIGVVAVAVAASPVEIRLGRARAASPDSPAATARSCGKVSPGLLVASYLGGSLDDRAAAVALDGAGNAVVVGTTQSGDFPLRKALQEEIGSVGVDDAFVSKLDASGTSLLWSTFLGGSGDDSATDVALDAAGNVIVVGYTGSRDFPLRHPIQAESGGGAFDAFVAVISADGGQLLFGTYLGGAASDFGYGVALAPPGPGSVEDAIYVAGGTDSPDFPVESAIQRTYGGSSDAFIAALLPDRSGYLYSTYFGGGSPETARRIAANRDGAAYVTGYVDGPGLPLEDPFQPVHGGSSDAFVAKLVPGGETLAFSSYLGGSGRDTGYGLGLSAAGRAVVAGQTFSDDFPLVNDYQTALDGHSDAFVSVTSGDGSSLEYGTYLGGESTENGNGVAIDGRGSMHVTGWTSSIGYPLERPVQQRIGGRNDAIVSTLSSDGQYLLFSTFFGGSGEDRGESIAAAADGSVVIAGFTDSPDLPIGDGSFQPEVAGQRDGFVARMRPAAHAIYVPRAAR